MLELSFMPSLLAKNTLVKMGDKLLQQGEGYLVSQRGKELQIFLYNYSHYDLLYHYRHVANISRTDRNQVFVCQQSRAFYIRLQNLPEGMYRVSRYGITRSGGSSYDAWVRMGAPSPVSGRTGAAAAACLPPFNLMELMASQNIQH